MKCLFIKVTASIRVIEEEKNDSLPLTVRLRLSGDIFVVVGRWCFNFDVFFFFFSTRKTLGGAEPALIKTTGQPFLHDSTFSPRKKKPGMEAR